MTSSLDLSFFSLQNKDENNVYYHISIVHQLVGMKALIYFHNTCVKSDLLYL